MMRLITSTVFVLFLCVSLHGQTVSSGSTGADGPFNPPGQVPAGTQVQGTCAAAPGCTVIVPLREPPNQVFNFTTVTISPFVTVTFRRNAANTPVFILAQGDVTINGQININGDGAGRGILVARGGPGGFGGGIASVPGSPSPLAGAGGGPGGGLGGDNTVNGTGKGGGFGATGGTCCGIEGGAVYGIPELLPLIGGSGGGAGTADGSRPGGNGGGGGGALLIASSGTIDLNPTRERISIFARGGSGSGFATDGSGGSGGAIRLVATTIRGNSTVLADGGGAGFGGGVGRIRFESFNFQYTGSTGPQYTFGQPGPIFPPILPTVRVVSVAGVPVTGPLTSDILTPDVTVPASFTNPVSIVLEATSVPSGTRARVIVAPQVGGGPRVITPPVTLTGSAGQPKRGTATATLPTRGTGIISAVIDSVLPEP